MFKCHQRWPQLSAITNPVSSQWWPGSQVGVALSFPEFGPDGAGDVFLWLRFVPVHDVRRGPPFRVLKSRSPEVLNSRVPSTECVCSCSCSFFLIAHGLNQHTHTPYMCMKLLCVGSPKPSAICRLTYLLNPFLNSVFGLQVSLFSLCFIRLWMVLKFWIGAPLKLPSASGITNHSTHIPVPLNCWNFSRVLGVFWSSGWAHQAQRLEVFIFHAGNFIHTPDTRGKYVKETCLQNVFYNWKIVSAPRAYYDFYSHQKWLLKLKVFISLFSTETDISVSFGLLIFWMA